MLIALTIYFLLLGLIVGSFLNVVILRYNTGRTIGGRSGCMVCKKQLTWKELIPIISWIIQKGRCKECKTRISMQYPLVELFTGLLFAGNFLHIYINAQSIGELIILTGITTVIWALLIFVFVYDLKHKIIPDLFSFSLWGMSVLFVLVTVIPAKVGIQLSDDGVEIFLRILAGLFFYFCIWVLWKVSKGRWIGLGDAKLLLSIGTILGLVYGLSAVFVAFWIGTIYALYILCIQRLSKSKKHITMKSEIPLGPFLILGFAFVYFTGIDVTNLGFLLQYYAI